MSRTNKNFSIRRNEILNKVWTIFLTNGYENTTLALILKELAISKGVFYHYFSSKEDCAEAAVDLYSDILIEKTMQKCQEHGYEEQPPIEKLKTLFTQGSQLLIENPLALDDIHSNANKVFHQMLMVSLTKKSSVIYAKVIQEGVDIKCFHTEYPLQLAEMILVLSNFYFDVSSFGWEEDSLDIKIEAYKEFIAKGLGIKISDLF